MRPTLLLVEDHHRTREALDEILRRNGYAVRTASHGGEALAALHETPCDAVLSDYRMHPMDGLELLRSIRRTLDIPFILYSSGADAQAVFRAGRDGAFYFLEYPFAIEEQLIPTIEEGLRSRHIAQEELRGAGRILGRSVHAHRVRTFIRRVAPSQATVLITGDTGTGKEVVARAIHEESGRTGPLIAVSLAELAEGLLDSELFGHRRGAFTGALASRRGLFAEASEGTLFLDEIGDAPPAVQAKLLRVLESRDVRPVGGDRPTSINVRVISATHRDLLDAVKSGDFRQDLLFRIRQSAIHLTPLRQRPGDIEVIARSILRDLSRETRLPIPRIQEGFLRTLRSHPWAGNVRELRSLLQSVMLWWDGSMPLAAEHVLEALLVMNPRLEADDQMLCQQMVEAYRRHGWNQEAARRELGMSRGEWRHRWSRFGLDAVRRRRR